MSDSLTDFVNSHEPHEIWVCEKCGSTDIEIKVWVNINTHEYVGDSEYTEYFCNNCNEHYDCPIITQEEFNKRQENK